ncbi:MAG: glycerophosphodiester phosphodiesterase [Bacteroidia bacterium]
MKGFKTIQLLKNSVNLCVCSVLLCVTLTSCQKESFTIVNLNNNRITTLGHSGMGVGRAYPTDTYKSVLNCLATGADGTEINVQMTKDNVLVAFHDEELGGATNLEGMINSHTWAELEDAYYDAFPYKQFRILQFDNFFSKLSHPENYFFTFDCKLFNSGERSLFLQNFSTALITLIEKHQLKNNMTIESNAVNLLLLIQQHQPAYKLFYYPASFDEGLEVVQQYNFSGITIDWEKITREEVETAHNLGIYIAIWNTHTKQDNIDAVRKNPDFIQSDKIEHLVDLLD